MLLRRLKNLPCSLLHTADRLRRNNSQILFLPLFVHKVTVEVFICVFNSIYGFTCYYAVAVILIADTVIAAL